MTECNSKSNFELDLHNFQSIPKAHLEFEEGINLIVGQSNSGKSATLRAVKATVLNPSGAHRFIKQGTEDTNVNIKYINNDINWFRNKKESKYTVNNEEYIKVGNSNLFKILENNGFVVDDKNNLMNIESELELPFPFDRSSAELFKLFENVFCVSDSTAILKAFKEEEDRNSRDRSNLQVDVNKLNSKINALISLQEDIDLEKLRDGKKTLLELDRKCKKLSDSIKLVKDTYSIITKLKLDSDKLKLDISEDSLRDYIKAVSDFKKVIIANKLSSLIEQEFTFDSSTKYIEEYENLVNDLKKVKVAFSLTNIELKDIEIPTGDLESLEKLTLDYKRLLLTRQLLGILKEDKDLIYDSTLLSNLTKLQTDFNKVHQHRRAATKVRDSLLAEEASLKEIEEKLSKFKVCPLCGSNIGE